MKDVKARFIILKEDGTEKKVTIHCRNFSDAEEQLKNGFNAKKYKPIYFGWCKFNYENMEWEEVKNDD